MARRFWSPEVGIGLGAWSYLMIVGRARMFRDPGTFWHTVVGRQILGGGGFPEVDPFTFTHAGRPWIAQQWLGECAMAVAHDLAGLDGLLLATVTILAAAYGWLAHRLLRSGLAVLPTATLVFLAISASAMHFHARPLIATIAGLALTCGWLGDVESGRRSTGRLAWLVPVFLAWTNTHGGVLGGLATLAFVVVGWSLLGLAGRESPASSLPRAGGIGLIALACALTAVANPYGARLPALWLGIVGSPAISRLIVEHGPPRLDDPSTAMIGALGLIYALALLGVPPGRWRATWLVAPLWLALALGRVRNAPLFAVAALAALADILPRSRLGEWLARPGRDLFRPGPERAGRPIGLSWLVPVALVSAALALQVGGVRAPIVGRGWAGLDPDHWPVELLPELRRAADEDAGGEPHVFNEDILGGFITYHVPRFRIFMDDRYELYGDAWLTRYDGAERDPEALLRWLGEYRVDHALVRTGSGFDRAFHDRPGWALVKKTAVATLYRRDRPGSTGRGDASRHPPG